MKNRNRKTMVNFDKSRRCFDPEYVIAVEYKEAYNPFVRLYLDAQAGGKGAFCVHVNVPPEMTPDDAIRWVCESAGMNVQVIGMND